MEHVENEAIKSYRLGMMLLKTSLIKMIDCFKQGMEYQSLFLKAEKVNVKYQRTT